MFFVITCLILQNGNGNIVTVIERKKTDIEDFLEGSKGLSILHQNIRGLLHNFCGIQEILSSNKNIKVLTLSETHVKENENIDDIYKISGYNFESRRRSNGIGGGVAVYIQEDVNYIRRFDLENSNLENIVIEIVLNKSTNIIIATHYRPPNSSKYLLKNFSESFEKSLSSYCCDSKEIILLGDINVNYSVFQKNGNKKYKQILLNEFYFFRINFYISRKPFF